MTFYRTPNQQDLSWFIDMREQGKLELDPPYQRKSVWTSRDKQEFLDTIFNNYPCPAIYLQKENTDRGPKYNVIDGKQRLSTVLDFYTNKIRLGSKFGIPLLRGLKFKDLPQERKNAFYNYIFMVEQIRSDNEDGVDWGEVFQRVNKNQKTLKEQELRHARFDGWFIKRAEEEADTDEIWKEIGISSKSRTKRMKDVEFISILMLVVLENDFVGFPQSRLDELYAQYEFNADEIPDDETEITEDNEQFLVDGKLFTRNSLEEFDLAFSRHKAVLLEIENFNSSITKHKGRILTDMYSLWCVLVLTDVLSSLSNTELANKFDQFMTKVESVAKLRREGVSTDDYAAEVTKYYDNSVGASTELDARKNRHDALLHYLKKSGHEN